MPKVLKSWEVSKVFGVGKIKEPIRVAKFYRSEEKNNKFKTGQFKLFLFFFSLHYINCYICQISTQKGLFFK